MSRPLTLKRMELSAFRWCVRWQPGHNAWPHPGSQWRRAALPARGGGSEEKPVGTVCICARLDDRELYETARFNGSRSRVIDSATTRALILAVKLVKGL